MIRCRPHLALLLALGCSHTNPVLIAFPEQTVELSGVSDEDAMVAAVRVLAAYGVLERGADRIPIAEDAGYHWLPDGVLTTAWTDVESTYLPTFTGSAEDVRRRHSFRAVVREGTFTFAVDCTLKRENELLWRLCPDSLRNESFAGRAQAILGKILAEAKRRAERRRGPAPAGDTDLMPR